MKNRNFYPKKKKTKKFSELECFVLINKSFVRAQRRRRIARIAKNARVTFRMEELEEDGCVAEKSGPETF